MGSSMFAAITLFAFRSTFVLGCIGIALFFIAPGADAALVWNQVGDLNTVRSEHVVVSLADGRSFRGPDILRFILR